MLIINNQSAAIPGGLSAALKAVRTAYCHEAASSDQSQGDLNAPCDIS